MLGICLKYEQKNYGSKLQALATVETLDRLAVDFEIIQYNKKTVKFIVKYLFRCFNIVFINDRYDLIQKKIMLMKKPKEKACIERRNCMMDSFDYRFVRRRSKFFSSYEALRKQCPHYYDRVMVCSDQLWSPSALGSGFYNLMFAPEETPKISWAASFGVSSIPWYQIGRTRAFLNRIQYISVRENRGAEIVRDLIGRDVPVLPDPVFCLTKEEWEKIIPTHEPEWDKYVFCYFLGSNPAHREAVKKLAKRRGLKIVTLRHLDRYVFADETFGDYFPYDVDPCRFLNIVRNAECVCTDSFHGSAFSVIMEKPFLVFDRYSNHSTNSKNSRIDSLCENLKLTRRRYFDDRDIDDAMFEEIDYVAVREKIAAWRMQTLCFLKEALT